MCIRDSPNPACERAINPLVPPKASITLILLDVGIFTSFGSCLLYTSDAADERSSVDLGGRRIIKKKTYRRTVGLSLIQ
mgnify:CR=1 FL=1